MKGNNKKPAKATNLEPIVKKDTHWLWYAAGIIVLTIVVYWPSLHNALTNWDDQYYVTNNGLIRNMSLQSVKDFFGSYIMGNYHPLTMLTLALDYKFFKLNPGGYHLTNLFIHICNALLVFVFIKKLSGNVKVGAIASLLFAVHPMHVESVAWVSERKDVLYTFFYLSALCIYLNYLAEKKITLYITVFVLFILSLFSKGVAVTLPLVLLLVDYYSGRKLDRKAMLEKVPFLVLSVIFGVVAVYAQRTTDALDVRVGFSYVERILFACYGIVIYLWKFICPFNLSCFYDYPVESNGHYPVIFYLSPLLVAALAYLVYRTVKRNKDILFAALFFVFTIVLVLQIFPVGKALFADRYTYVPYIGLFFLVGKWIVSLLENTKASLKSIKPLVLPVFGAIVLIFAYLAYEQCKAWKNSLSLWTEAIEHAPSALAYYNRGIPYMDANDNDNAMKDFDAAIAINDKYVDAYINRSTLLQKKGQIDKALEDCNKIIAVNPAYAMAYNNKSNCFIDKKQYDSALSNANKCIQLKSDLVEAYCNKGTALYSLNKYDEAIAAFDEAIKINPALKEAYYNRSGVYFARKQYDLALADALKAKELGYVVDDKYIEALNESIKSEKKQ